MNSGEYDIREHIISLFVRVVTAAHTRNFTSRTNFSFVLPELILISHESMPLFSSSELDQSE